MNRFKKEERRKYEEERQGLTVEQIKALDRKEDEQREIGELAKKLHIRKFPEEYFHMYDSIEEANDRSRGKNPMSKESIEEVNQKRASLGVSPLSESGMSTANDTMALCIEDAKRLLAHKHTRR